MKEKPDVTGAAQLLSRLAFFPQLLLLFNWLESIAKDLNLYHGPVWQKLLDHVYRNMRPIVLDNQVPPTIYNMNKHTF